MMFPRGFNPPERLMSRFLAKMGLEVLAQRFSHDMTLIRMLVDEQHYDRIRNWARRGDYPTNWPIHSRQIYPEDTLMRHPDNNEWVQAGFGYDLLMTRRRETFFVFGLYGYEFVINMGGPSIKGYIEWLKDHTMISPLVERLGLTLKRALDGDGERFYLVGDGEFKKGRIFDAAQLSRADGGREG
jgi:hypothetical protein